MLPDILFHYQSFNETYLRTTIVDGLIGASAPNGFNDPWDCAPQLLRGSLENERTRSLYFERMYNLIRPRCASDDEAKARANHFLSTPERRQEFIQLASDALIESHANTRVYCLSGRRDSALMWGHYARNHTGVCLGFRAAGSEVFSRAVSVEYAQSYPSIDPWGQSAHELARRMLAVKSRDWSYEEEYRLLLSEGGATPGVLVCNDGFLPVPDSDLVVVILGCRIDSEAAKRVGELVAQRSTPIRVLRATKAPDRYQLEFGE
jgi:hypothetical protein